MVLAIAESCTGGLISARITSVPGSSAWFDRAAIVYSNTAKTEILGVPKELIDVDGAVSPSVAAAMAEGVRRNANSDIGLSVTGIAGPGGGTPAKPVGLVYLSCASRSGVVTEEHRFCGNRNEIRRKSVTAALTLLLKQLESEMA